MPFVEYINQDATQALTGVFDVSQRQNQPFLLDSDPKVVTFRGRLETEFADQQARHSQGRANARNANSVPQLIQGLKDAGLI